MRTNTPTGRVLVPLDGSELAEAILPLLERTHHLWGSEAVLIRSVTMDAAASSPAEETEAGDYLATQARRWERAGLRVRCEGWHGDPSQAIVNAAVRVSTHGWGGPDRLRFGSVAGSVVRTARIPVLLVRREMRWPVDRPPRILVPLGLVHPVGGDPHRRRPAPTASPGRGRAASRPRCSAPRRRRCSLPPDPC